MPPNNKLSAEKYDYENIHLLNVALGHLFQNVGCSRKSISGFSARHFFEFKILFPMKKKRSPDNKTSGIPAAANMKDQP